MCVSVTWSGEDLRANRFACWWKPAMQNMIELLFNTTPEPM